MPAAADGAAGPALERRAGSRQGSLRANNLRLVLGTVCSSTTPVSRAEVAALTSMTRATVSRLVDELVEAGLLAETGRLRGGRVGRPATPLVAGSHLAALGLQANVSYLAARVVDLSGRVVSETAEYKDFVSSDADRVLGRLGQLAHDLLDALPSRTRLVGAGLALPGLIDPTSGRLLSAPNLGWSDLRPADLLGSALLGMDLSLGNEADLAARTIAETAPGRPGALSDFLYLSGEIGIGGAAVLGGRVASGQHGWAGEIGHVCVDPRGPACRCGSTGCLEQYAGRHALLRAAGLGRDTPPAELAQRAAAGDERARAAVAAAGEALSVALAGAVNLLDISTVVLGGHLGQIADLVRPFLEARLQTRVLSGRWAAPRVERGSGADALGAHGAALRELSAVLSNPSQWISQP